MPLLRFLLVFSLLAAPATPGYADGNEAWLLDIREAIGPASADYVARGLRDAAEAGAPFTILRIDTPGGLDKSMRQIVKAILNSPVPVVGFVAPGGARAASAGTYILYACHVAAMAPATNLGAATPVQIGGPGMPTTPGGEEGKGDEKDQTKPGSAMEKKVVNDAVAYIRSLAELRARNADWAEQAVREGESLAAEQALTKNVIDLIAANTSELLSKLDGRVIQVGDASVTLSTTDTTIARHEPDWRSEFLSVITDPNVAYILMLVGIYGLIFEFSNPGMGVPGITGAICILLALYAFQVLPISYAGLGLIFLGIALMVAEAFAPSFGVLGLGGVVSFVIGSIILMDTELPGYQIAWPIIAAVTVFSALLMFSVLGLLLKSRRHAVVSGLSHLVGQQARIESVSNGTAYVWLDGERWQVRSNETLQSGDNVEVIKADGVYLTVAKTSNTDGYQEKTS